MKTPKQIAWDRRNRWRFLTGEEGLWLWRVAPPDGREVSSKGSFGNLTECIADAKRNGYMLWTTRERRQAS